MPTPLQPILEDFLKDRNISLFIKREDLNHPTIQGNKFRKLKYNLAEAKTENQTTLLTFGGAFSNHIYATAAAGAAFDFKTIGIIRGERIEPLNDTLQFAEANGMELHFINRSDYKRKNQVDFIKNLKDKFGDFYLIPEGGSNELAVKGCTEIVDEIEMKYDYLCSPIGTGGTITGLIKGTKNTSQILGFPALKGGDFLIDDINELLKNEKAIYTNWELITDYHFGGYAKFKPELIEFINNFKTKHLIQLEPIYTGKMLFGIYDLIQKDYFPNHSTIIAIHTGGLRGIVGFNKRFGELINC